MSGWDFSSSQLHPVSSLQTALQPTPFSGVCPSCHKTVQSGRFCSECGSSLAGYNTAADSSLLSDIQFSNASMGGNPNWDESTFSGLSSTQSFDLNSNSSLRSDIPSEPSGDYSVLSRFSGRRFSMDTGDNSFSSLNGNSMFANSRGSSLLSYPSQSLSNRRRSSTSGLISFSSSFFPSEDYQVAQTAYAVDQYESSTEPDFQHYDISNDSTPPHDYHLQDDDNFSLHTPSTAKVARSLSEIDYKKLSDSYDHNLISGMPDPLSSQMNSDYRTSRRNSVQTMKQDDLMYPYNNSTFSGGTYPAFSTPESTKSRIPPVSGFPRLSPGVTIPASYKGRMLEVSENKKLSEFSTYCNHVVELVCTQNGSKGLQNYLNSNMSETVREIVVDQIIGEIENTGCKIICDTFGNYFYQLLFKKANSIQKEKLLRAMLMPKGDEDGSTIYDISINKTGTFAFQNIIDFMSGEEVLGKLVMDSLQNSRLGNSSQNVTLQLIKENKGTHIIQRIMKTFSIELWEPIYSILLDNCFTIAMDRNGSMVLRLCYDLIDLEKKEKIAKDIISHSLQLAVDPVGNYVVQHILSIPEKASTEEVVKYEGFIRGVLKELSGHYIELSKQKYSSNVVEKSIVNSAQLGDHTIYDELLDFPAIMQLLDNHYGIYVLQKILQSLSSNELFELDGKVKESFQGGNWNTSLLNKWKQILNKAV